MLSVFRSRGLTIEATYNKSHNSLNLTLIFSLLLKQLNPIPELYLYILLQLLNEVRKSGLLRHVNIALQIQCAPHLKHMLMGPIATQIASRETAETI